MSEPVLPEAVERVLQQFEAMAPASDWRLRGTQLVDQDGCCVLAFMGGGPDIAPLYCGLDLDHSERALIFNANDGYMYYEDSERCSAVRARLLAAAGLA